jgi:fatty acid desaturase
MATPGTTPTAGGNVVAMLKAQWVNITFFIWLLILTIVFIVYTARFVNATSTVSITTVASGTSVTKVSGAIGDTSIPNGTIFGIQFLTGLNILLLLILFMGSWFYLRKNVKLEERPYILTMLHASIVFSIISLSIICLKKINSKPS